MYGRQSGPGCASTSFLSNGLTYTKVCGQVRGYQFGHVDGLASPHLGIEGHYVDGVSITHGTSPRKHIWTYIGGNSENSTGSTGCPCNTGYIGSADPTSTFIGSHYYCESGNPAQVANVFFPGDPLWDGEQCDDREAPCCPANSKMPWFYRSLDTQTSDDIELRVCSDKIQTWEETPLDIIELYIK